MFVYLIFPTATNLVGVSQNGRILKKRYTVVGRIIYLLT